MIFIIDFDHREVSYLWPFFLHHQFPSLNVFIHISPFAWHICHIFTVLLIL